jgi:hypothetical protein
MAVVQRVNGRFQPKRNQQANGNGLLMNLELLD